MATTKATAASTSKSDLWPTSEAERVGLERERRLLRGLLEASASMHEALALDEVLGKIATILAKAGGFAAVAVYMHDPALGCWIPGRSSGLAPRT